MKHNQDDFYNQTLFTNIVLFCYYQRLSSNYNWKEKALKELKHNIILKWPKEIFGNVFVFIELLSRRCEDVNPIGYFKRIFKKGRKCIR